MAPREGEPGEKLNERRHEAARLAGWLMGSFSKAMKVSKLIEMLQNAIQDGDKDVEFLSYEWTDDLEDLEYQPRNFEAVKTVNDKVQIHISR